MKRYKLSVKELRIKNAKSYRMDAKLSINIKFNNMTKII